ncbi:bifunctional 5,10-methylenetetrahydrofolate dehydrogenase/5,10-methenyltetrahydrofolate cyclohydrolase [Candidatus Uhrbacteria bacterium]|nr:bifunctional 5,10-methylenetetrahydrofolate dehydrogenase/5,10-methenyltetrahydrofolate cyclohydrolase [Candidatus Uhrbacteria bacterium]
MGQVIDGKAIAAAIRQRLQGEIVRERLHPALAIVLVGDDPASRLYVGRKMRACAEVGIRAELEEFPASVPELDLLGAIAALNARADVHGMIVQQPLPAPLDRMRIIASVAPEKDVDGLHPENFGRLLLGHPRFIPATPKGIRELLLRSGHDPAGAHVVIVGRGMLVGRPLAALLLLRHRGGNATVTVCHTQTPELATLTRTADILVAATGQPGFVTADMVRPGAVVIDVGIHRITATTATHNAPIVGDVDFDSVREVAGAITPVPGGVGPMTVAMLLENVVEAARHQSPTSP